MDKNDNPYMRTFNNRITGDKMSDVLTDSPTFSHLDQSCIRAILLKFQRQFPSPRYSSYSWSEHDVLCKVLEKVNCNTIEIAAYAFYSATMEAKYGGGGRKCKKCDQQSGCLRYYHCYEGNRVCGKDTEYYVCSNPRCRNSWNVDC